jgi:hypothetical protein
MRGDMYRKTDRKTGRPPARAGGTAEDVNLASGDRYREKGRPPARAGGMSF